MAGSKPASPALISGCVAFTISYATHPDAISSLSGAGVWLVVDIDIWMDLVMDIGATTSHISS